MKLTGRAAERFCAAPDLTLVGALIFGDDAGQVAQARRRVLAAVLGDPADDLRLTAVDAAAARRAAAPVSDALRAQGFFPGRRVVLIEGGTDGLSKPLAAALEGATSDDAFLVVTADALAPRSTLRKLFEGDGRLAALHLYADAPGPEDVARDLKAAGAASVTAEAAEALAGLAVGMDRGSLAQLVETVTLHARGGNGDGQGDGQSDGAVGLADVQAVAPEGLEIEIDTLVIAIADGDAVDVGPLMRRVVAGGATSVSLLLALQRHFRVLLRVASLDGRVEAMRPPLYGPRKAAVQRQVRRWDGARLEQAMRLLMEADARVRSGGNPPDRALVERCALRLALMAGK